LRWRACGRNYPLVLLLVLIGALFWPTRTEAVEDLGTPPSGLRPGDTYH
jgi:hypothetical protein